MRSKMKVTSHLHIKKPLALFPTEFYYVTVTETKKRTQMDRVALCP